MPHYIFALYSNLKIIKIGANSDVIIGHPIMQIYINRLLTMELKQILKKLIPFISLILFLIAIFALHNEIKTYHLHDIRHALHTIPLSLLTVCVGVTLISYIALSFYDYLALEYAGEKLPYRNVLLTSFLSYAISNNVGHAWLSGGSMRYRLYSDWDVLGVSIAKVVLFSSASYFIGAVTILEGGYYASLGSGLLTDKIPSGSIHAIVTLGAILLIAWWGLVSFYRKPIFIKGISLAFPRPLLAIRQLLVSLSELISASLVLYIPLYHFTGMSFSDFLVMYMLAQLAGLISQVPGGIGVFESSFTLLASTHYPASNIVTSLIVYRVVYYFIPLLLAGSFLAIYELKLHQLMRHQVIKTVTHVIESAIPQIFSLLLMLGAAVLLFSGATPALNERLRWLEFLLPIPLMELSHLIGSIAGVLLLLISLAVRRRIDSAYFATIAVLIVGIISSLGKGFDYEEAIILGLMLISFIPAKKHFYRKSALLQLDISPQWLLLATVLILGSIWVGFFSYKHVEYSNELWWQFALHGDASRFLRSQLVIVIILTGFISYRLLTHTKVNLALPNTTEIDKANKIIRLANETSAYLALTGDKYLLWSQSGNSFLMFNITSQYWVVMGDPIGLQEEYEELVWKLRTWADQHNAKIAFYQVGTQHLPLYLDLGLALIKLGEEARVPLDTFTLEGKKRSSLRHSFNKLQREGLSFEVIQASDVETTLPQLKSISDHWIKEKNVREKRFSLGFFKPDYLCRCKIAVIYKDGNIVAFANMWELENKKELSIDLMRYESGVANGVMEYLMVSLMLWGKEHGYQWFNLGMAPLSGLERHPLAPLWNKIGNTIFSFGHEFYNFDGLYQYKNKFDPTWQPRYLAAPNGLSMATALLSITTLISGNIKGIFSK